MTQENYIEEDEIDLRELFKTIWKKRFFILIFTFAVTALAFLYVYIKTPIYEVKSVVRIGYLNSGLVEESNVLEKKLRLIFNVDSKTNILQKDKAIVSNISAVKKVENFLEISTQAFSNELAILKNKEVVEFLQKEYKYKIDEYILRTNLSIKNLEEKIDYIEKVEKVSKEEEIDFLNKVDLKSIENKLTFNKEKLKEYQENINKISSKQSTNDTQNMLTAMQILNYQNLILNLQNQIENLNKEKENILNEKIPAIQRQIKFNIATSINDLKDRIDLEKLKLTNSYIKNSEIVGEAEVSDNPIKPKKKLIVAVAFVTGFILSIFLVFILQFIGSFKEEK